MSYRGLRNSSDEESIPWGIDENDFSAKNESLNTNFSLRSSQLNLKSKTENTEKINTSNTMATRASISEIKEYVEMIPVFRGEAELLNMFISESSKIINNFYDATAQNDPRNDFITSRIRAKIQGDAALYLANKNISTWDDLRKSLVAAYADKRDDATLAIHIAELVQKNLSSY